MIKVYASGAARSRRVLWACEELGAPYEVAELKFPPRLHHPEFLAVSPAGAVPAIEDGDRRMIESLAICEYVSRRHGGSLTVEPDQPGYWDYLQFLHFGDATLAPPLGWARRLGGYSEKIVEDARTAFSLRLAVVARALADGREFLAAGRLTLADISVGYALGLSELSGLHDLLPPEVAAYEGRLKARPAYQRAYAR
jgi:glutathione S-transferase